MTVFFSWRQAILDSKLQPTTRHVLLTLSCHMNDAGESCYPSISLLCKETGLSNRAVITHLQKAADAGWIEVAKHGFAGQRWARNDYKMAWPYRTKKVVNEVHDLDDKAVNLVPQGSEPNDIEAVNEVHTSTPSNSPKNTPLNTITKPKKLAAETLLAGIDPQVASDYLALRKAKNLPLTQTALDGIVREGNLLGYTLEKTIRICCERNWGGFKAEWILKEERMVNNKDQVKKETTERAKARLFGTHTEKDISNETTRL